MNEVFVDSFFWLAMLHPRDAFHLAALAYKQPPKLVTSVPVLLEVLDACAAIGKRAAAAEFWTFCHTNPSLRIVPLDKQLLDRAVSLYSDRLDKSWSLTDCISFTIMAEAGIELALTADKHFEQAGFQRAFT